MKRPARGLFVVGTDTEVGKTYVSALLAQACHDRGEAIAVYKPVASGCIRQGEELVAEDAVALWEAAGQPGKLHDVTPQRFEAPLAPSVAARLVGREVDLRLLREGLSKWSHYPYVLVEGVGGLLSPLGERTLVADLAAEFAYPLLLVVPNELGVINQTLLTLIAAEKLGLPVRGIVFNDREAPDESSASNPTELARFTNVPILAHVPWGATTLDQDPTGWM